MLLPEGRELGGLDEAFRRSLTERATLPENADPMGPLHRTWSGPPVGTTGRHGQGVDVIKDVLAGS